MLSQNKILRKQRMVIAKSRGKHTHLEWELLKEICNHCCAKCGTDEYKLEKDHIVPVYQSDSSDGIDNIQPLCALCNSRKGPECTDYRPEDWRMKMQAMRAAIMEIANGKG